MSFRNEKELQEFLEQQLKVGLATVGDVHLFCEENKLTHSNLIKTRPNDPERMQKHESTIGCGAPAPAGRLQWMFSDWRVINLFRRLPFIFATWTICFYFDSDILSEIEVQLTYTGF